MANTFNDPEFEDSKLYKKLVNELGETGAKEFISKSPAELEKINITCQLQKQEAKVKMQANSHYAEAAGRISDFKAALRDTNKPLDLKIAVTTYLLGVKKTQPNG